MSDIRTRPILFSGAMVRALLDGTKTQTRRIAKLHTDRLGDEYMTQLADGSLIETVRLCPYGQPGDRLWCKETHLPKASGILYRADINPVEAAGLGAMYGGWKPSIFCRREYSRITLEVVSVRIERLQSISDADASAEGCSITEMRSGDCLASVYARLWESINGHGSWNANPWVWVVEFKNLEESK